MGAILKRKEKEKVNYFRESLRNDREQLRGEEVSLADLFEKLRRSIGQGYQNLTEHNLASKSAINALKRGDEDNLETHKNTMRACWDRILSLHVPNSKFTEFTSKAGQELIEFFAVEATWPYIKGDKREPGAVPSAEDLEMRPQTRLHGLGDVPGELGKMVIDLLLDESISREEAIAIRARLVEVVQMIVDYLTSYENTYGLVIDSDLGRTHYFATFRGVIQRAEQLLCRMKEELIAARSNHALMSLLEKLAGTQHDDHEDQDLDALVRTCKSTQASVARAVADAHDRDGELNEVLHPDGH